MHIFNMSGTGMQGFKKIHGKLWEKLITQTLYHKVCDERTDGQTDGRMYGQTWANFNAPLTIATGT